MSPRVIRTSSGRLLAAALAVPVVFSSPFGIWAAKEAVLGNDARHRRDVR